MKKEELLSVNDEYSANEADWIFYKTAYKGSRALIDNGYIEKHARESLENYTRRKKELYGFSYSRSIIDILSYFLMKEKNTLSMPEEIQADPFWDMFVQDSDLNGNSLEDFFLKGQKNASKFGHVGIIVDKPNLDTEIINVKEAVEKRVYPYFSMYTPLNILDWEEERDPYGRPFLSMLKLREENANIKIWYPDKWELWQDPDSEENETEESILLDSGANPLGKIPFVWLYNTESDVKYIGESDITDISRIDLSIIRNLSQGEEVVDYSAFPMLRAPISEEGTDDVVGVTGVLQFDPDNPDTKSDWLEAECKQPIDAILVWIKRKIEEIYRLSNIGGIKSTETAAQAQSGTAKKIDFQMLNSRLIQKSRNIAKALKSCIKLWLEWQGQTEYIEDVTITVPTSFDIENLQTELENALVSSTLVISDLFKKELQKQIAKQSLPDAKEETIAEIDAEIDAAELKPDTTNQDGIDKYLDENNG